MMHYYTSYTNLSYTRYIEYLAETKIMNQIKVQRGLSHIHICTVGRCALTAAL